MSAVIGLFTIDSLSSISLWVHYFRCFFLGLWLELNTVLFFLILLGHSNMCITACAIQHNICLGPGDKAPEDKPAVDVAGGEGENNL